MLEDVDVLIPWRGGDPQREAVWNYLEGYWYGLGANVIVGQPDDMIGPFNCSSALNNAFNRSTGAPYVMTFGADCIPDEAAMVIARNRLQAGEQWVPLFSNTQYYNKEATDKILQGDWIDNHQTDDAYQVPFQTGVLAMTREAFLATGGSDERFVGWGAEDSAFRMTLYRLFGDSEPIDLPLRCLWHDVVHRGRMSDNNWALIREYEAIQSREEMIQYLANRPRYV